MFLRTLFGYDIFISYSHKDAVKYAAALANQLGDRDFRCFLDQWASPRGAKLPRPVKLSLLRSTMLVLVGTNGAVLSPWVKQEVESFSNTGRVIIPIDIDSALPASPTELEPWAKINGVPRSSESGHALKSGEPSKSVTGHIINSFYFTRRNKRMRMIFLGTAILLIMLLSISVYAGRVAILQQEAARNAVEEAKRQEDLARVNKQQAQAQEGLAREKTEALRKETEELEKRTTELHEQEELAKKNAAAAKRQQGLAEERQRTASSRELASNAVAQIRNEPVRTDPEQAVILARQAFSVQRTAEAEDALRRAVIAFPGRAVMRGHTDTISDAEFSLDNRKIVTASKDQTARIWDTVTGAQLVSLSGHGQEVLSARFSPDNKFVVTTTYESVRVWDAVSGRLLKVIGEGANIGILSAEFSPDSKLLVSSGTGNKVLIWETGTWKLLKALTGHTSTVTTVSFSHDGHFIVSGGNDGATRVWSVSNGEQLKELDDHESSVRHAEFSPDDQLVLIVSGPIARVWELSPEHVWAIGGEQLPVYNARFSRDSHLLLTSSILSSTRVVDFRELKVVWEIQTQTNSADFSPDGKYVVTGAVEWVGNAAEIWDAKTGAYLRFIGGPTNRLDQVKYSPDGAYILSINDDMTVQVWEGEIHPSEARVASAQLHSVDVSPDSKFILTVSGVIEQTADVWEMGTGKHLWKAPDSSSLITAGKLSADGKLIAVATYDDVHLFNAKTWEEVNVISPPDNPHPLISSVDISPDNKYVLTVDEHGRVLVQEMATKRVCASRTESSETVTGAEFNKTGELVLLTKVNWDGIWLNTSVVKVWEWQTGRLIALRGHTGPVLYASFSPDGKKIITSSTDGTARLWDASTGLSLMVYKGHTQQVRRAALSTDGNYLLTASADGTASLWEAGTGRKLRTLRGHSGKVVSAEFSHDGHLVAILSEDGFVRVWKANTGQRTAEINIKLFDPLEAKFSPDDKFLLVRSGTGELKIYPYERFEPIEDILTIAKRSTRRKLNSIER